MSRDTISQFSIARDAIRSQLGVNIPLASDTLVEDFFSLVGERGDQGLVDQAGVLYRLLRKDNPRRSKSAYLQEQMDNMLLVNELRYTTEKMAA